MAYWRDFIYLYEAETDLVVNKWASWKPIRPSIHYLAKKITDRAQLLTDIETCLQNGFDADHVPSGARYGTVRDGGATETYDVDEHVRLLCSANGFNRILYKSKWFLSGYCFFDGKEWQSMRGDRPTLSETFRKFVHDNNITGPFHPAPMLPPLPIAVKPKVDLALHRATKARFGQYGVYVIDL